MTKAVVVALAVVLAAVRPAAASAPEDDLLWMLNEERADAGVEPSTWRDDIAEMATEHSAEMAREGELRHNEEYLSEENQRRLGGGTLGEVVAFAPTVEGLHTVLVQTDEHRAVMRDHRLTVVGIGVYWDGERWWVTEAFLEPQ